MSDQVEKFIKKDFEQNTEGYDFVIHTGSDAEGSPVPKKSFYVHKFILGPTIPYFRKLFDTRLKENQTKSVDLLDVDGQSMLLLLSVVYQMFSRPLVTVTSLDSLTTPTFAILSRFKTYWTKYCSQAENHVNRPVAFEEQCFEAWSLSFNGTKVPTMEYLGLSSQDCELLLKYELVPVLFDVYHSNDIEEASKCHGNMNIFILVDKILCTVLPLWRLADRFGIADLVTACDILYEHLMILPTHRLQVLNFFPDSRSSQTCR